jgi:hypothetical protein
MPSERFHCWLVTGPVPNQDVEVIFILHVCGDVHHTRQRADVHGGRHRFHGHVHEHARAHGYASRMLMVVDMRMGMGTFHAGLLS